MKGLSFLSPWLAALFGAGGVGFPELAGPTTGNQRGQQRRDAANIKPAQGYQAKRTNLTTFLNPKRNAQRKQYRAMRLRAREHGTVPAQQRRQGYIYEPTRSTHG